MNLNRTTTSARRPSKGSANESMIGQDPSLRAEVRTESIIILTQTQRPHGGARRLDPPSRNVVRSLLFAAMVILPLITVTESLSAADESNVWTVQKLNDNKPWDRFVGVPVSLRVEGRMLGSSTGQFRLQHCDAIFKFDKEKLPASKSHIEVKGQFKKDGTKVVFFVDELKLLSDYADQFDLNASRFVRPKPEDWVELGDWANERAKFYDDAELAKRAGTAYTNAIKLEHNALKRTDAAGRMALAKKIEDYKLSDRWRMELVHEAKRVDWLALQKTDPPNVAVWREFSASLEEQLPGARDEIKSVDKALKEHYDQEPEATYQKASDEVRRQLHRLFYVSVVRKSLLQGESGDGRDGDAIANQIDAQIPEEHALAEQYRVKKLEFGLKHISTMTRGEIEILVSGLRDRLKNDDATQALAQWIKSHEVRLRGDGVVGLLQLADEYDTLLKDKRSALECLLEAGRIDPTFEGVSTRLTAMGYELQRGRWMRREVAHDESSESKSPTGISVGMSAKELRSLLGQPRSLARAITARGITEVWSFGPAGSTQLVIRLEQKAGEAEAKISAFSGG